MKKSIVFASSVIVSMLLAVMLFPPLTVSSITNLSSIGEQTPNLVISILFFILYLSLIAVSAMTELKKPFVYAGIAISSLFPIIIGGYSPAKMVLSIGLLASSAIYYARTHKATRNMVHFHCAGASESSLGLSLGILTIALAVMVFFSSGGLSIESMIPDSVLDMSLGMLGGQVESMGCSMTQTITECATAQASAQISAQSAQLISQCDAVRANTVAYNSCVSQVNTQIAESSATLSAKIGQALSEQLGATNTNLSIQDAIRNAIRGKLVEILAPYEKYVPSIMAIAAFTIFGAAMIIANIFVPIFSVLVCKLLIALKFLEVEKVKIEVEVLK